MDILTPEQRRRNMQAIRSNGTRIEVLMGKALWQAGLRYRKNDKSVFGKPDFAFKTRRIAVFCDSEFWHGKNWSASKHRIKSNVQFWHSKIEKNIQRDLKVNQYLKSEGWIVIRFWASEITKSLSACVKQVLQAYKSRN